MTADPRADASRKILMDHLRRIADRARRTGVTCEQALSIGLESPQVKAINEMLGITTNELKVMFKEAWTGEKEVRTR